MEQSFIVENAGCSSCAEKVHAALAPLAAIQSVEVHEDSDTATVTIAGDLQLAKTAVNAALAHASNGSGHQYRVQSDSWQNREA